jgi:6-phosphogluconate dehydrogenase
VSMNLHTSLDCTEFHSRRGPSMCPGSDDETLDMVMPLLEKVAAKGSNGKPCVGRAGTGGAGHYVKMIHNGIEHGMMSAISEAWGNVLSVTQVWSSTNIH